MDGYVRELYAGHELSHRKTSLRFFPPGTRRYRRTPLRELADPLPYKNSTKKGERKKKLHNERIGVNNLENMQTRAFFLTAISHRHT